MKTLLSLISCAVVVATFACSSPSPAGGGVAVTDASQNPDAQFGDSALPDGGTPPQDVLADVTTPVDTLTDSKIDTGGPSDLCKDGESACHNATLAKYCVEGAWILKAKCAEGEVCQAGECVVPTKCTPGENKGCNGYSTQVVCNEAGNAWTDIKCKAPQQCAAGECRTVVCTPGFSECVPGNTKLIRTCAEDGSGYGEPYDCKSGATCFGGKCLSLCESNIKVTSNVGCEYWSVDLDNYPDPFSSKRPDLIPHSIVVSNPGIYDANLTFTVPAPFTPNIPNPVVKAGASAEFKMPVFTVDGNGIWPQGIRVKSDQPIVAFQFNPFNAEGAASNDGSLLLPMNALGMKYFAVTRPSGPPMLGNPAQHGYFTVAAASPGTTIVKVTVAGKVEATPKYAIPALAKGQSFTFTLKQHDVLNLEAFGELNFKGGNDLTGSYIDADKPIAVFAGHEELVEGWEGGTSQAGYDSGYAEHVEEQLMPLEAWGNEAFCVKTKPRGIEPDIWFVMAGEPGVSVTTTPSIKGLDGKTFASPGEWVRVESPQSFMIKATGKIQVVQFIVSMMQTDQGTGDPTMMIIPPKFQYRTDYNVLTADGYGTNWTTVVRPKGVEVKADGVAIGAGEFMTFGDGTWEYAYVKVGKGGHVFEGAGEFGLMVYGFGTATAYGYPGGMNLGGVNQGTP